MSSLPYPTPPVQAPELPEDDYLTERLRGLSPQQLLEAMQFLAWWSPGTFTAVMDYCEVGAWGTDDLYPDQDGDAGEPMPCCARCGGDLGIFLKFGLDWRHYTGTALADIELYDPGHPAELTWRTPALAPARVAA
jgi:hypothetical protein